MKRFFLSLMLCLVLVPVGRADDANSPDPVDKAVDSLMKVGVKLLEKEAQKLEGDPNADPDGKKLAAGVINIGAKLLEKQRQEMAEEAAQGNGLIPAMQPVPLNGANPAPSLQPLPQEAASLVKQVVQSGVDAAVSEAREDARREQQEIADSLNARVDQQAAANDRVQDSVASMQWVCWALVAILVFVLILLVGLFYYIHGLHKRLDAIK